MRQNTFTNEKDDLGTQFVAVADATEQGASLLIGGAMVLALAAGGLAIGYVSPFTQWLVTGFLGAIGLAFTFYGVGKMIIRR